MYSVAWLLSPTVRQYDASEREILEQLATCPPAHEGNRSARLGYHSRLHSSPSEPVWVQVDLGRSLPLDAIAIVPARVDSGGFATKGYGFPLRFRLDVSDDAKFHDFRTVLDRTDADFPNPGDFPVLVPALAARGRYVRLTSLRHWRHEDDWIVALGEIIVLSGRRNVAIGRPVTTSSVSGTPPAWLPDNLVDGQSSLGPPVSIEPSPTNGYLAAKATQPNVTKWVQVDLGRPLAIDEVRLFPARPTDFADEPGHGFPVRFRIEASSEAEFLHPVVIADCSQTDFVNPGDNPVIFAGGGPTARYVRLTATRLQFAGDFAAFALGELQVYSGDRNVALGAAVACSDAFQNPQFPRWAPQYLVDGYNSHNRLIEFPDWLASLQRRQQLEMRLGQLRTRRQEAVDAVVATTAKAVVIASAAVIAALGLAVGRQRGLRKRHVQALRAQIASDLHDDIGSNLGSIAFISQLAMLDLERSELLRNDLGEIGRIARETSQSMRDIIWLTQSDHAGIDDLTARLREVAATMLGGRQYRFQSDDGPLQVKLELAFRRQVFLIFKEALCNIVKHSGATVVRIDLHHDGRVLRLVIADDGKGFDPMAVQAGNGLSNLRKRADSLHGKLLVRSSPATGTTIELRTCSKIT